MATPGDMTRLYPITQSDTIEESFFQACNWLDLCGITLNPEKFRFAQDEVEFAGFEITTDTVRPCKKGPHRCKVSYADWHIPRTAQA